MVQREAKSQERGLRNRYRAGGAIGMYSDHVESQLFANFQNQNNGETQKGAFLEDQNMSDE